MTGAALALCVAAWLCPVELRGGAVVDAPVEEVSIRGVGVGGDEPRVIGWDNVKRVMGEGAEDAAPFMEMAERAWRARVRLARGDFGMASGLLESLFERFRGEEGPTALMVAEGTLACRLWFGDRVGAVEAWLESVRLRGEGYRIAGDPPLFPMLDPETLLAPGLAPVWLGSDELVVVAGMWKGERVSGDDVAGRLRVLYAASARRELGMEFDEEAVSAAALGGESHPGVMLVGQMVEAMGSDGDRRVTARASLRLGLDEDLGTWREAWRRAALGRSLLLEESEGARLEGLFELVHLPARFSRSRSHLAGVALSEMIAELERRGETGASERLRGELESRHRGHPGLRWLDSDGRGRREAGPGGEGVVSDENESGESGGSPEHESETKE